MKTILAFVFSLACSAQVVVNSPLVVKGQLTTSANMILASQIPGVVLDANLTGASGQTCTGNSAKFNTALAALSAAGGGELKIDGASCLDATATSICINLNGLSNVTISGTGPGSGFFVKAGANCAAISNTLYPSPGTAPSQSNSNITIRDLAINGNNAGQTQGSPGCTGGVCFAISIFNTVGFTMEGLYITNVLDFATVNGNNTNVRIANNVILQRNNTGTDPIHLDGPFNNVTIYGNKLQSGDDCVAVNLPEGYGGNGVNLIVSNNEAISCAEFMRVYNNVNGGGSPSYALTGAIVDGVSGTITCVNSPPTVFNMSDMVNFNVESGNLKISNIDVDGSSACMLIDLQGSWSNIDILNWKIKNPLAGAASIVLSGQVTSSQVSNGLIERTLTGQNTAWPVQVAGSNNVKNLSLSNIVVVDISGQTFTAAPQLLDVSGSGTVTNLSVSSPASGNGRIAAFLSSGSAAKISNVFGAIPFPLTIANLPTCTAAMEGNADATVTNGVTSPGFLATVSTTGSTVAPVKCNGTNWIYY